LTGCTPVIIANLEGAQAGAGTLEFKNDIDISAKRLKLGVFIPRLPAHEFVLIQSFKSSIEINNTFGFLLLAKEATWELLEIEKQKKYMSKQIFFIMIMYYFIFFKKLFIEKF
jgi:hypothetical protein